VATSMPGSIIDFIAATRAYLAHQDMIDSNLNYGDHSWAVFRLRGSTSFAIRWDTALDLP